MAGTCCYLGIELGSTRIKAVLLDGAGHSLVQGVWDWESCYTDGYWSYDLELLRRGLAAVTGQVLEAYHERWASWPDLGGLGISAMMHGYIALDAQGRLLCPFRSWRNRTAAPAAQRLERELGCRMPERWTAAHLYQAALDGEEHLHDVHQVQTLAGYVQRLLGGEAVLGLGDAAGVFPLDAAGQDYDPDLLERYQACLREACGLELDVRALFPRPRSAGLAAGRLSAAGARILDPQGRIPAGILLCPPEGDAGTGMVAAQAVEAGTGNISVGTSAFAMLVTERRPQKLEGEVDLVATPEGKPVLMVHANNACAELDQWVRVFRQQAAGLGLCVETSEIYSQLYLAALEAALEGGGSEEAGNCLVYPFLAGEALVDCSAGAPLIWHRPDCDWNFKDLARAQVYAVVASLVSGLQDLGPALAENRLLVAHGGYFKSGDAGLRILASALGKSLGSYSGASEGGARGMALLAAYAAQRERGQSLSSWLSRLQTEDVQFLAPEEKLAADYHRYLRRYRDFLPLARQAAQLWTAAEAEGQI